MTLTQRVLIGLLAGLAVGMVAALTPWSGWDGVVGFVAPIGRLWVNAIRMTVIPLIVSLLITGIASGSARHAGSVSGKSLAWFAGLILMTLPVTMVLAPLLLGRLNINLETTSTVDAGSGTAELPPFSDFLVNLIPTNPIASAAEGTLLPLIVFSILFGLAVTRLADDQKKTITGFFAAVVSAMYVIVEWILAIAPIGVFALILPLAAENGLQFAGAVGGFLLVVSVLVMVSLGLLYPVTAVFGGVSIRTFARAVSPVQAVGFSTRSSLATLPAMVSAAENELNVPERITAISLPLAASVFKYASPTARLTGTLFVAQLYGVDLAFFEFVAIAGAIGALSFYSPGIPSGGLFVMTPIYVAFGLPVEGVGLLIALDLIPDMFITMANVTADVSVATILGKGEATDVPAPTASAAEADTPA